MALPTFLAKSEDKTDKKAQIDKEDAPKKEKLPGGFENSRLHLFISGDVQGVFYRAFAREAAQILSISGWARNTSDNKVEIIAEGQKRKLEDFIKRLRVGPASARPGPMEISWESFEGEFRSFDIRYDWGK